MTVARDETDAELSSFKRDQGRPNSRRNIGDATRSDREFDTVQTRLVNADQRRFDLANRRDHKCEGLVNDNALSQRSGEYKHAVVARGPRRNVPSSRNHGTVSRQMKRGGIGAHSAPTSEETAETNSVLR